MELKLYEAAKHALAEYRTVDEVKDFRDKAAALQHYAEQAGNHEMERDARVARMRAERRFGELYKDGEKAKRGPDKEGAQRSQRVTPDEPKTLDELGVTKRQSTKWQKWADVPEDKFEEVLQCDKPESAIYEYLKQPLPTTKQKQMHENALWWYGTLRRAGEKRYSMSFLETVADMNAEMQQDMNGFIDELLRWIDGK